MSLVFDQANGRLVQCSRHLAMPLSVDLYALLHVSSHTVHCSIRDSLPSRRTRLKNDMIIVYDLAIVGGTMTSSSTSALIRSRIR